MTKLNIPSLLKDNEGRNLELHRRHVNPAFAKVLKTIGFDRNYIGGKGAYLWDENENKYLDMLSGYGVFIMGRNHPGIRQALADFLAEDYGTLVQMEAPLLSGLLAEKLKQKINCPLDYAFFTNSGTESIEGAIKFARCATGRTGIVHSHKSFHGLSTGSLALNGDSVFKQGFGKLLPDVIGIPFNDLDALEKALHSKDMAAFVVEPIQGKGVNIPDSGYLREAARLCHRSGSLLIVDEVQSGMGRTGKFLAMEHDGDVAADIVVLSKALSGGYVPVGAILMTKSIYKKVFSTMNRAVIHSSTFGQGSLAMIAGLATLHALDEEKLLAKAEQVGNRIGSGLEQMIDKYEFLHEVRYKGLMCGIEFSKPSSIKLKTAWNIAHQLDKSLFSQAITIPLLDEHRILTQVAGHNIDVIKLLPSAVLTQSDIDWFLQSFEQVMQNLHRFPGPAWDVVSRISKNVLKQKNGIKA